MQPMQSGTWSRPGTAGARQFSPGPLNPGPFMPASGAIQQQALIHVKAYEGQIPESAPLLTPMDLKLRRRVTLALHTCLMITIFLPFTVFVFDMARNLDVMYFCGYWIWMTAICPFLFISFAVVAFCVKVPKAAFVAIVMFPCAFLAIFFFLYSANLSLTQMEIKTDDCAISKAKQDLQQAYSTGVTILEQCTKEQGSVPERIEDCPMWENGVKDMLPEMLYLSHMEHKIGCSGMCEGPVRLFSSSGQPSFPCNLFISQDIQVANLQSRMCMWYSVLIMIIALPCYYFMSPMLDMYYVSIPASTKSMHAMPVQQAVWTGQPATFVQ